MNDRERILTMLAGDTPDRVPWFGDLAYWAAAMEGHGQVPQSWQGSPDYYQFHRDLGIGFYLQGYFAFRSEYEGDIRVDTHTAGSSRHRTVHTPLGALSEEWVYLPESSAWAPREHLVKTPADLEILRYWVAHTSFYPNPGEAERRRPWLADLGVVLCYLPRSPFMELVANLAGITAIVRIWMEATDAFDETLRVMAESADRAAEAALAVPADCFMIPENLSSEVVGRRFYERYVQSWERRWVERIRVAGRYSFIHMDGTLKGLLSQVAETGYDVIEAVTPAPVGDLAVSELRAVAGPRPILWGGIPGIYFTNLVSDAEFDRHVAETLETMVQDRRMVLGVADQVPPDGTPARMARVARLVERCGYY